MKVKDAFKVEYRDTSAAGREALARKLLEEASHEDLITQFVMLEQSRDLAAKAGDLKTALGAVDSLSASFNVDAPALKVAALTAAASGKPPPDARHFAEACADLSRQVARAEDVEATAKAADLLENAARILKEPGFSALAQFRSDDAKWEKREYAKVKGELSRITKIKDDEQLNSDIGRYYCFVLGDFDRGLPLLAKGANPELKELAAADLAAPEEMKPRMALGDRWWKLAETQHDPGASRIVGRSGYWYERALPDVTGLEKIKVQRRLNESRPSWLSEMPMRDEVVGAWGGIGRGTTGRETGTPITVDGQTSPHGLGMHPPSSSAAHVTFDLDKQYKHLVGAAAVSDLADKPTGSPLTFRVVGDGRELWRSKAINSPGVRLSFLADVSNVSKLELFVDCPGYFHGCYAVWAEPQLYPW